MKQQQQQQKIIDNNLIKISCNIIYIKCCHRPMQRQWQQQTNKQSCNFKWMTFWNRSKNYSKLNYGKLNILLSKNKLNNIATWKVPKFWFSANEIPNLWLSSYKPSLGSWYRQKKLKKNKFDRKLTGIEKIKTVTLNLLKLFSTLNRTIKCIPTQKVSLV